jgi:hypothetical protein
MQALLQDRDERLQRLEERLQHFLGQSLPFSFCPPTAEIPRDFGNVNFKLKPDIFDGSVPLREYFTQFELIARVSNWEDSTKAVALASSLRGKARSILDGVTELEDLSFEEIKSKLELRFGEGHMTQTFYTQFSNHKQKFGEDLASLRAELERLARLAYPECPQEVRDKIACVQFIIAVSDRFLRRTLQLEEITCLRSAIERAKTIKTIQESSFPRVSSNKEGGRRKFYSREQMRGNGKEEISSKDSKKKSLNK